MRFMRRSASEAGACPRAVERLLAAAGPLLLPPPLEPPPATPSMPLPTALALPCWRPDMLGGPARQVPLQGGNVWHTVGEDGRQTLTAFEAPVSRSRNHTSLCMPCSPKVLNSGINSSDQQKGARKAQAMAIKLCKGTRAQAPGWCSCRERCWSCHAGGCCCCSFLGCCCCQRSRCCSCHDCCCCCCRSCSCCFSGWVDAAGCWRGCTGCAAFDCLGWKKRSMASLAFALRLTPTKAAEPAACAAAG